MKHPEEVKRIYLNTDEEVLQMSEVMLGSFQENKSRFVERFPILDDPYASEWATLTANARKELPDYASVAGQSSETKVLDDLMDEGRSLFQTVMLFARMAFPDDMAVLRLFGHYQYNSSRTNQLKLPVLLRTMFIQVSQPEYKEALMAKGLKESEIDMLEILANSIISQDVVQQRAKNGRSLATSRRISAMNLVWEKMSMVSQCAKLVFQDDAARYNLFLLTESSSPKPVTPSVAQP